MENNESEADAKTDEWYIPDDDELPDIDYIDEVAPLEPGYSPEKAPIYVTMSDQPKIHELRNELGEKGWVCGRIEMNLSEHKAGAMRLPAKAVDKVLFAVFKTPDERMKERLRVDSES